MVTKQNVADIDHERRVREVTYALARLVEVVDIGHRINNPDLVAHALREIAALEAERDAWT